MSEALAEAELLCDPRDVAVFQLVRRCAWCSRVLGPGGWDHPEEPRRPERETSTICPECCEKLRALGESK